MFQDRFKRLQDEIESRQLKHNLFIPISKIAHELFEHGYYDTSERLLEFTINEIDTSSLLLKMSALSTLSACYWKQSKFNESIRCMNLEFNLVSHLNDLQNKYRILGNIANAYQLLNNYDEAKNYFKLQLSISLKMKNRLLTIHSLNSLGNLHIKCKEYEKALECYNKSLSLIQLLPSTSSSLTSLNSQSASQTSTTANDVLKRNCLIKQYNLIGDCFLKLNQLHKSRSYYLQQLEVIASDTSTQKTTNENFLNFCKAKLNLALIETKLNHYNVSIQIYEELLQQNKNIFENKNNLNQKINLNLIEIYFKINICLLNTCIKYNKIQKAIYYAQDLLDFSLNEQNKLKLKLSARSTNQQQQQQTTSSSSIKNQKSNATVPNDKSNIEFEIIETDPLGSDTIMPVGMKSVGNSTTIQNSDYALNLKYYKYLKFIELCACSKLACCFAKLNNLNDAFKLYERELKLAKYLQNINYITRSYSHLAQIMFLKRNFSKCIVFYKEILNLIKVNINETTLVNSGQTASGGGGVTTGTGTAAPSSANDIGSFISVQSLTSDNDKRLLQMTYYTLSNLGLCMEMLNRYNDAYLLFIEQYELSKRLNNLKYNANALLNIINLYFKYEKSVFFARDIDDTNKVTTPTSNSTTHHYFDYMFDTTLFTIDDNSLLNNANNQASTGANTEKLAIDNIDLKLYLYNLLDIYQELNDLNGELFISQCLAYYYHKNNMIKIAIKFYLHNIEICKLLNNQLLMSSSNTQIDDTQNNDGLANDETNKYRLNKKHNFYSNTNTLEKSLFNLSICYRIQRKYQEAYKYQLEYLYLVKLKNYTYSEFISLGIIADLLLEINANYDDCIKIHVRRLRLVQENLRKFNNYHQYNHNRHTSNRYNNELEYFTIKRCQLIADCLASIAKCYFLFQDYQQVYKFKLMEFKLRIQDEQQLLINTNSTNKSTLSSNNNNASLQAIPSNATTSTLNNYEFIKFNKQKFKILLDLGNLLLFKLENYQQALYYYEYAYKICKLNLNKNLILLSLSLGNLGLCKLKLGNYDVAISHFKEQTQLLHEKLNDYDMNKLNINFKNINLKQIIKLKEYISINLDIGRSYSKLSKCYECLNQNINIFDDDAYNYLIKYMNICENLNKTYFSKLNSFKNTSHTPSTTDQGNSESSGTGTSDEDDNDEIKYLVNDIIEQLMNDYDLSLYKLAKFYLNKLQVLSANPAVNNANTSEILIKYAINLNEKRLSLFMNKWNQHQTQSKNDEQLNSNNELCKLVNKLIEINYSITNLYLKLNLNFKCFLYLVNIINIYKDYNSLDLNKIIYIQSLCLYYKLVFQLKRSKNQIDSANKEEIELVDYINNIDYKQELNISLNLYDYLNTIQVTDLNANETFKNYEKLLQLKYSLIKCIIKFHLKLNLTKNLIDFLTNVTEKLYANTNQSSSNLLIEVLFKLNFKLSILLMNIYTASQSNSNSVDHNKSFQSASSITNTATSLDTVEAKEIHINKAIYYLNQSEFYLNSEKTLLIKHLYELRMANLCYYKGIAFRETKNFELSLEMFASSLDLYENFKENFASLVDLSHFKHIYDDYKDDDYELIAKTSTITDSSISHDSTIMSESFNEDIQETTNEKYLQFLLKRIDLLYELLEDLLIKMNKLKEALLVTERHRTKFSPSLLKLNELNTFEQIENMLDRQNQLALIYFHLLKFNSTINCWLLEPGLGITKFHQISFKSLNSLFLLQSLSPDFNFIKHLNNDANNLLKQAYNILIKPFEINLFNWFNNNNYNNHDNSNDEVKLCDTKFKQRLCFVYDENLLTIPFNLIKCGEYFNSNSVSTITISKTKGEYCFHELFNIDTMFSIKYLNLNLINTQQMFNNTYKLISNENEFENFLQLLNRAGYVQDRYKLIIVNFFNDCHSTFTLKKTCFL